MRYYLLNDSDTLREGDEWFCTNTGGNIGDDRWLKVGKGNFGHAAEGYANVRRPVPAPLEPVYVKLLEAHL